MTPRLALRLLWREGWQGELRWFVLALALCVTCVVSVALMADRLNAGLKASGREFIGGDRVLVSPAALPASRLDGWRQAGARVQTTVSFNTMLFHGEAFQLASLRAVPSEFPFYGSLKRDPVVPLKPGAIWLSPRLMQLLGTRPGERIEVGNTALTVSATLLEEPDQGFSPFQLAPRALVHSDDLARIGALLPGSRQEWRYLLKVDATRLDGLDRTRPMAAGMRWLTPESGDSRSGRTLANAERFFRLAALTGVLLGALAMAIAVRHFAERQTGMVALLKTLGASRATLWRLLGSLLLGLTLMGGGIGLLLGLVVQGVALASLQGVLPAELPPPSWRPFVLAMAVALFITLMLSLIPFLRLLRIPPLRVLRREVEADISSHWAIPVALLGLFILVWGLMGDGLLALGLIACMGLLMGLLALLGGLLLRLGRKVRGPRPLRLALARMARERGRGLFQLAGFSLALLLLGLLWAVRSDLMGDIARHLPADAPNRFLVNLMPEERIPVLAKLKEAGAETSDFYPMVRGRLTRIAGEAVAEEGQPGREGIGRELNFTTTDRLPFGNRITAGEWLNGPGQVSVDEEVATRLGIRLGDELGFTIEGRPFTATVTSLRAIRWDSLRPNFFMIFSPDLLEPFSLTWMGSYRLPAGAQTVELDLVRSFPTVSLIDVEDLINRLVAISAQVSRALGVMLGLVTAAALLVLLAQTQASLAARRGELIVMRTLGAPGTLLSRMLSWELMITGAVAGLCAALVAEGGVLFLQLWWFSGSLNWHPQLWVGLPLLGALLVTLIGQGWRRHLLGGALGGRLRAMGHAL
ncbi:ABC transporter permease [Aeromonas sp. R6-2]|uniref:ABC transporter permease n=1 Tax=Aeromonas sp. R6-2 TaxID=3138472 RepID=UPI0034A2AFD6